VEEREHLPAALAVDELAGMLSVEQELVTALVGTVLDSEVVLCQRGEAIHEAGGTMALWPASVRST
jgi:hypothetical protein